MNNVIQLYMRAAQALKLEAEYHEEYDGMSLTLGNKQYLFRGGMTVFNDAASCNVSFHKYVVNQSLARAGIPVPKADWISTARNEHGEFDLPDNIPYPIVAKPTVNPNGGGRNVFCNIQDEATLLQYLKEVEKYYHFISIEAFEPGLTAYRVLVFYNKVIGVTRRDPAFVTGDGKHNIAELIEIDNELRAEITEVTLGPIIADRETKTKLTEMNLTLDYIPKEHEKVVLCYGCNSSRGGTMTSLGQAICPENAELVVQAAKVLNLNLVGFDVICEDIMQPIMSTRGFIIEANCNPDISINEKPLAGISVPVTKILLRKIISWQPFAYIKCYLRNFLGPYAVYFKGFAFIFGMIGIIKLLPKI